MDDKYRKHNYNNYLPQVQHNNKRYIRAQNPSFSSTLLDQIYRSIDETNDHDHVDDDELVFYKGNLMTVKHKQYIHTTAAPKNEADFQQIQNWMEKSKGSAAKITKTGEKSAATHHTCPRKFGEKYDNFVNSTSSWSSSDSSSAGGLLSSEAESNYGLSSRSSSTTTYRPKPIKTSSTDIKKILRDEEPDHESGGVVKRSKLKALKIYGDLNKARQPISPGAKLANFLNSLFTTGGNAKKGKTSKSADSLNTSPPACSTSRSCLSKTPGKLSNKNIGTKRSVRFYPVSVIVDEDCQPCGHKSLQHGHGINKNLADTDHHKTYININEELAYHIRRKDQRAVEEAARELFQSKIEECGTELEDDDDDASYASSDLFELDNLNNDNINNGMDVLGNYMKELPVYQTTYLDTY